MMHRIGTQPESSGMGDVLLLTAICKHIPGCVVELHPAAQKYTRFFEGLCEEVIITETPTKTPDIGLGHYAKRKLRHFGLEDQCYLPHIKVSDKEIQYGKEKLRAYQNPIAFVPNCAGHWRKIREPKAEFFQQLIDDLSRHHTILQFGLSANYTEYRNTIPMLDLSIEELICCYSAIGRYVGVCTGDLHLMLAVGGCCDVYASLPWYKMIKEQWHYESDRVRYHMWTKWFNQQ